MLNAKKKKPLFFSKRKENEGYRAPSWSPRTADDPAWERGYVPVSLKNVLAQRKELANLWNFEKHSVLSIHTSL